MRILMVNDYKQKIAGTEVYIEHITATLEKEGHVVELFASNINAEQYFSPTYNKSFVKYILKIFNISYFKAFRAVVKEFKPDIIHIHNIYNEISPSILFSLKVKAVIMTVHDSRIISPVSLQTERMGKSCKQVICDGCINCVGVKGYIYEIVKRNIYKYLFKRVILYITPSEYLKSILIQKGYKNVMRLYNGISLFAYSPIQNKDQILFVGRLIVEKGVRSLIDAMDILIKTHKVHLTIAGDGDYKDQLVEKVKSIKLGRTVTFVGSLKKTMLEKLYSKSTIVVIPSLNPDNLPTVGLEALSVGRPIVGSSTGGIPEIVSDQKTGLLFIPGDVNALAKKIEILLDSPKLLEMMSKNARKYAEQTFDITQHTIKLIDIYSEVIKNTK